MTTFPLSEDVGVVAGITTGPDGNIWFTSSRDKVGRMSPTGSVKLFDVVSGSAPGAITPGPDGNLWFIEGAGFLGRITTDGVYNHFPFPTPSFADSITAGPDGKLWFSHTASSKIGTCTVSGLITEHDTPTHSDARGIARGPGGTMWFLESGLTRTFVVRIAANGDYTEFPIPTENANPQTMAAGADDNMWFTEVGKMGRITPDGRITEFSLGVDSLKQVVRGPGDTLWITAGGGNDPTLVRLTNAGTSTLYAIPEVPIALTTGPDNNIWYTQFLQSTIARFLVP